MKNKTVFFVIMALIINACTPMDHNIKDFVKDGPVVYLTKLDPDDITIVGERERAVITLPAMKDLRPTKVLIYWANRTQSREFPINPEVETKIDLRELKEGAYIFEFILMDEVGNKSLTSTKSTDVYGSVYETYLLNRSISSDRLTADGKREIIFAKVTDATMQMTLIEWSQNGTPQTRTIDATDEGVNSIVIDDFTASSFKYRTIYKPGNEDIFWSPPSYVLDNPDVGKVVYDGPTKRIELPSLSNDDYWRGYEIRWIDRFTLDAKTYHVPSNATSFNLPEYAAAEFYYSALFQYDGDMKSSSSIAKSTSERVNLNRTGWYVPLETEISTGRELANVSNGTWSGAYEAITAKNKSPYLSQKLPYENQSAPERSNSPRAHIEGTDGTCLVLVKGPGTSFRTQHPYSIQHKYGGVSSIDVDFGKEIYFIIDMGKVEDFDYFRIVYRRIEAANTVSYKPQGIQLYGSNDPACINDHSKWTAITDRIEPPFCTMPTIQDQATHVQNSTGNVPLRASSYRYIKCSITDWVEALVDEENGEVNRHMTTIQIAQFYLGQTIYF